MIAKQNDLKQKRNTLRSRAKDRMKTLKSRGKLMNNIKSNPTIIQFIKQKKQYNKLVQQYNHLIQEEEKKEQNRVEKELAELETDLNDSRVIEQPNTISPELREELNKFKVHERRVQEISNILAGKTRRRRRNGTRRRRSRNNRQQNPLMGNSDCNEERGCCGKACNRIRGLFSGTGGKRNKTRRKSKRKKRNNRKTRNIKKRKRRNKHKNKHKK